MKKNKEHTLKVKIGEKTFRNLLVKEDEVATLLETNEATVARHLEYYLGVIARKIEREKDTRKGQFDKHTVKGVLSRTYHYQKNKYWHLDKKVFKKGSSHFIEHWSNDKKFKKIWKKYEKSGFDEKYKPYFVRSTIDHRLRVGLKKDYHELNTAIV